MLEEAQLVVTTLQPWQRLCSRKNALQIPQFIPQGAIRFLVIRFGI